MPCNHHQEARQCIQSTRCRSRFKCVNAEEIDVSVCLLEHLVAANKRSLEHCGSFDNEGSELYGKASSM